MLMQKQMNVSLLIDMSLIADKITTDEVMISCISVMHRGIHNSGTSFARGVVTSLIETLSCGVPVVVPMGIMYLFIFWL